MSTIIALQAGFLHSKCTNSHSFTLNKSVAAYYRCCHKVSLLYTKSCQMLGHVLFNSTVMPVTLYKTGALICINSCL